MITLTSNEQAKELIKNGVLAVDDDIEIAFDGFSIEADIKCHNIYSKEHPRNINCGDINCEDINCEDINCEDISCLNITCGDITCGDIACDDITCGDINCLNIDCRDINCGDINCWNITCRNINCWNITCGDITCGYINYYAVCFAYNNIKCKSIKGRRENCKHFCLDGEITFKDKKRGR